MLWIVETGTILNQVYAVISKARGGCDKASAPADKHFSSRAIGVRSQLRQARRIPDDWPLKGLCLRHNLPVERQIGGLLAIELVGIDARDVCPRKARLVHVVKSLRTSAPVSDSFWMSLPVSSGLAAIAAPLSAKNNAT
jgi:hypothetical protein